MPYKTNEARRHKIAKARYRIENWRAYEAALRERGDLTVWVTPEALESGMMLRLAFGRPWRQTEGLLRSVAPLMNSKTACPFS